jgi:hypothetical protein
MEEFGSCFKAQPGLASVSIYRLKREYSGIASIFFLPLGTAFDVRRHPTTCWTGRAMGGFLNWECEDAVSVFVLNKLMVCGCGCC